ncbi:excinuclease ABC subunit UvrB [Chitinivibrio alkaliphilus]|uniref:UvrABC system protein B n=1 Tax=Chitinivibrio alkaliphilus ACht1 TaxID=1313304 RepID=U7DCS4_9BACT|nr:excinuclease ABC subunit UvrB [Chitinivibrio alkaliphilus]ERP39363.1 excinuclease ABC subunit B [Chitinivibrio alkaliphilus ACht1]
MKFTLKAPYTPRGDQPTAIESLRAGIEAGEKEQTLLGVTGSGKTFTMANVIAQTNLPTLIISHNKTLAAQLYEEFKEFFPYNAVEYFVSFYDYYQPEAYLPSTDTYIEKTADINDEIDRLRLKATASVLSRKDVIIVASVSSIYNIGSPDIYRESTFPISRGMSIDQADLFQRLVSMQYIRNDIAFERGTFRVRGDVVDIFPAYEEDAVRISFFGDEVDSISVISPLTGKMQYELEEFLLFPAKHYVSSRVPLPTAIKEIEQEMEEQMLRFEHQGKLIEAQRLRERTRYDMEMLEQVGYINGIENYSRILDGRAPGSRPSSLLDFFEAPFLTIIDESHITIPQIGGMYNGDRARKQTLVDHGFRIPSALDNRPLRFEEFEGLTDYVLYSSATPADYELEKCQGVVVEQIIRPTGLVDPPIEIRPAQTQVDDLIHQLREVVRHKQRALVTTLTKQMSEDLTEYLDELGFSVRYLHSEIDTLERPRILSALRKGEFDILVGINLLREGLDLPEVALVAILDADREGFLRSSRSLIQIAGRAARNRDGRIIFYADRETKSITTTVEECNRRRTIQLEYNTQHGITPESTVRRIDDTFDKYEDVPAYPAAAETGNNYAVEESIDSGAISTDEYIAALTSEMEAAAAKLEFERAARLRDMIADIEKKQSD